jgi:hypothetical protein
MSKTIIIESKTGIKDIEKDINGKPLSYRNNFAHRNAGTAINLTPQHITEFQKCAEDINYFIENYAVIQNAGEGLGLMKPYDWQKELFKTIQFNKRVAVLSPRQSGKCCQIGTVLTLRNTKTNKIRNVWIGQFYLEQKIKYILKTTLTKILNFNLKNFTISLFKKLLKKIKRIK